MIVLKDVNPHRHLHSQNPNSLGFRQNHAQSNRPLVPSPSSETLDFSAGINIAGKTSVGISPFFDLLFCFTFIETNHKKTERTCSM